MNVRETLEKLIEEDGLDNISLNENSFTIYFGDVLNTETQTGNTYYLLDTYVQIPYSLEDGYVKLHRGIVNEYETGGFDENYNYSGFVHYGGTHFCWGQCGVDAILKNARLENAFTEDTYYSLVLHFQKYLATSSHDSGARTSLFKKLDLPDSVKSTIHIPTKVRYINDLPFISEYTEITKTSGSMSVDYSKPYKEVIKEARDKQFTYKGEIITPKVVKHYMKEDTKLDIETKFTSPSKFFELVEEYKLKKVKNEINSKKRITLQDCLHKLTDTQHRVDGSIRIQSQG